MARLGLILALLLGVGCTIFFACNSPLGSLSEREPRKLHDDVGQCRLLMPRAIEAHCGKQLARLRTSRVRYRIQREFDLPDRKGKVDVTGEEINSVPHQLRKHFEGKVDDKPYDLTWF